MIQRSCEMKIERIDFFRLLEGTSLDVHLRVRKEGVGEINFGIRMSYDPDITFREFEKKAISQAEELEKELRPVSTVQERHP